MTGELIFITGATGFIGAHVVLAALSANYRVRLSIRKASQESDVRARYPSFPSSAIETVLIPDITKPEAFQSALKDVDYVFHIASPLPGAGNDLQKDYVEPAVNGTLAVLKAALESERIRKVVVVSSAVALSPVDCLIRVREDMFAKGNTNTTHPVDLPTPLPNDFTGAAIKYVASKILAHQASRDFLASSSPHYNLIFLHPVYVLGDDLTQAPNSPPNGVNAMFWSSLSQSKPSIAGSWVHVRDVADAHIKALKADVPTGLEIILQGASFKWEEVLEFIKKEYPDLDIKLELPIPGLWDADTKPAEEVLGMRWRGMERIVRDVVGQQIAVKVE